MLLINAMERVGKLQNKNTLVNLIWETIKIHIFTVVCVWKVFFECVTQQNLEKRTVKKITYTLFQQTKIKYGRVIIVLCRELEEILFEVKIP